MFGSLVGETEGRIRRALKVADAMSPAILFVDEIEKALSGAGTGHSGDSGTSQRLLGTFLTWLNDHTSDVFFIGTCNDISSLAQASSGAFARAERFDGIFFADLPSVQERLQIWQLYLDHYKIEHNANYAMQVDDTNWTGAEIKACCRLASLLEIPLREAAKNIVPVATTAADQITGLREWANGRCLSANATGVYRNTKTENEPTKRRAIQRKEPACSS
jgi:SpoVK/Ycf46/Vps4 family AAA+-type ATPase